MARNIQEIYETMVDIKNAQPELNRLTSNSSSAIWKLILYVVAYGINTLEKLFDLHRREVNEIIENILPHRPKWYRDKALNFMKDKLLIPDSDKYDVSEMSDEEIAAAKVVKYATAIEETGSSILVIKIATGETGNLQPLSDEVEAQFAEYINEIRDAGVAYSIINKEGDDFRCELDIYYSALLLESDVKRSVLNAVKAYLNGLPFNGEYSNMALIDAVQVVEGVNIAEFKNAYTSGNGIDAKIVPIAGYFTYTEENITLNMQPHVVQQ